MADIEDTLSAFFNPLGYTCHPFKIGWYNEMVGDPFKLPYHDDTLAFCIISTPDMFEIAFKPFIEKLKEQDGKVVRDPLDQCSQHYFQEAVKHLKEEVDIIQDFELHANRRPKVLMQTAGHVAGAAYYYQRKDMVDDRRFEEKRKIFGASLHSEFGGWFAFRGVIIFKNLKLPDLIRKEPKRVLDTDDKVYDFLYKFNYHWKENLFRDVIPVTKCYSEEQKKYFDTFPTSKRLELLGLTKQNE